MEKVGLISREGQEIPLEEIKLEPQCTDPSPRTKSRRSKEEKEMLEKEREKSDFELQDEMFLQAHYPHRYASRHEPQKEDYVGQRFPNFKFALATYASITRSFFSLFSLMTLGNIALTAMATYLCFLFDIRTDLPISLLSVGVLFPLNFNIQYSNNRRERVLLDLASLKADIIALYQLHREWGRKLERDCSEEFKELMKLLVEDINCYICHRGGKQRLYRIYKAFDRISRVHRFGYSSYMIQMHESMRQEQDWVKSVLARAYQYQRYLMADFERIRVIHDYRTVSTLRGYSLYFMTFYPLMFAPYFAQVSHLYGMWAGMYSSVISSIMLVSLFRIQDELEDPFDEYGVDDINLSMLSEVHQHMF